MLIATKGLIIAVLFREFVLLMAETVMTVGHFVSMIIIVNNACLLYAYPQYVIPRYVSKPYSVSN